MCPALANDDALDFRSANRAGLALASIDPEMVLEFPAAVNPIDTGPVPADPFFQHFSDSHPQDLGFVHSDQVRLYQRMEPCHVQSFVSIDVSQPGQEGLIEQKRLELPVLGVQRRVQPGGENSSESGSGPRF